MIMWPALQSNSFAKKTLFTQSSLLEKRKSSKANCLYGVNMKAIQKYSREERYENLKVADESAKRVFSLYFKPVVKHSK